MFSLLIKLGLIKSFPSACVCACLTSISIWTNPVVMMTYGLLSWRQAHGLSFISVVSSLRTLCAVTHTHNYTQTHQLTSPSELISPLRVATPPNVVTDHLYYFCALVFQLAWLSGNCNLQMRWHLVQKWELRQWYKYSDCTSAGLCVCVCARVCTYVGACERVCVCFQGNCCISSTHITAQ